MRSLSILLLVLVTSARAEAAPVGLSTSVSWNVSGVSSCAQSGSAAANCDRTFPYVDHFGFPGTMLIDLATDANYGALRMDFRHFGADLDASLLANATSGFRDEVTLIGGTGAGYIQYFFEGRSSNGVDSGRTTFTYEHDGASFAGFAINSMDPLMVRFAFESTLLPFAWGTPITFGADGSSELRLMHGHSGIASWSLEVTGFRVFDADKIAVSDFALTSAAGAPYGTPVPEPSTLLLTGGGLILWHMRRVRANW